MHAMVLLPPTLLALVGHAVATQQGAAAIRKLSPDANEKLLPEHLAFVRLNELTPQGPEVLPLDSRSQDGGSLPNFYKRAFGAHYHESEESMLRRAAEALAMLQRRQSCPSDMDSCDDIGAPNKCCPEGTQCTEVSDPDVDNVACCPEGTDCNGDVGNCPPDAVSCPPSLGGGCCISGYICQGIGCVLEGATTTSVETTTTTEEETTTTEEESTTSEETTTTSSTAESSNTGSETGGAPWRPTITSEPSSTDDSSTQTGCPTGFYGCLATQGGGCCQTDRDCETHSCPAPSSTTIVSDGQTIVVPATDVPSTVTSTCADGWFLCGAEAGPIAGCCPSGYNCGTASCYTTEASETGRVQKEQPEEEDTAALLSSPRLLPLFAFAGAFLLIA